MTKFIINIHYVMLEAGRFALKVVLGSVPGILFLAI